MVVDLLLDLVAIIVDGLTLVLPQADLPYEAELLGTAASVNSSVLFLDNVLPLRDLLAFYRWVATVWVPGFVVFITVRFIVSKLPFVGGD